MFGFCSTHNSPFSVRFLFGISIINKHQYDKIQQKKQGKLLKREIKAGKCQIQKNWPKTSKISPNSENSARKHKVRTVTDKFTCGLACAPGRIFIAQPGLRPRRLFGTRLGKRFRLCLGLLNASKFIRNGSRIVVLQWLKCSIGHSWIFEFCLFPLGISRIVSIQTGVLSSFF